MDLAPAHCIHAFEGCGREHGLKFFMHTVRAYCNQSSPSQFASDTMYSDDSRVSFSHIQVNLNGVLSFKEKFNVPHPQPFPYKSLALISPYWGNFDTSRNGDVYYQTTNDSTLLNRVQYQLQSIFTSAQDFSPSYLVIVTWDKVPELGLAGNPKLVRITVQYIFKL